MKLFSTIKNKISDYISKTWINKIMTFEKIMSLCFCEIIQTFSRLIDTKWDCTSYNEWSTGFRCAILYGYFVLYLYSLDIFSIFLEICIEIFYFLCQSWRFTDQSDIEFTFFQICSLFSCCIWSDTSPGCLSTIHFLSFLLVLIFYFFRLSNKCIKYIFISHSC